MIDMSNLEDTLMTLGLKAKTILLKMWLLFRILSTSSEDNQMLDCLDRYRMPTILRYNFEGLSQDRKRKI